MSALPEARNPSARWTSVQLYAFRCGFVLAVLAGTRLAVLLAEFLPAGPIRQTAQGALFPIAAAVLKAILWIGAAVASAASRTGSWSSSRLDTADAASTAFFYLVGLIIVTCVTSGVWGLLDRRTGQYLRLNAWLRLYVRVLLALVALYYATVKIVPVQFGFVTPGEALRPFGELSRFHVLWNFMAVSPEYTALAGLVELCGAALLFHSRTVLLGSLLLCAAFMNVLALDLAYDVRGAVLIALLLVLLTLFLLAPYVPSLWAILVVGRPTSLPQEPRLGARRPRYATAAALLGASMLLLTPVRDGLAARARYFGRGQPLYGLFDVEDFVRNGRTVQPLATDAATWKRIGSDGRYGDRMVNVQFANGDLRHFTVDDDAARRMWSLQQVGDNGLRARFHYQLNSDGTVTLRGTIGLDDVAMHLRRINPSKFPLLGGL